LLASTKHSSFPPERCRFHRPHSPIEREPRPDSEYAPVVAQLRLCVREDPFHVWFPLFDCNAGIPTKYLSEISKTHQLSVGVHKVRVTDDDKPYVYKEVDIPLYIPRESSFGSGAAKLATFSRH